jgi:Ras-related protein Rab-1A
MAFQASCFNIRYNQLVVHGGFVDSDFNATSDGMYALDLDTMIWAKIAMSGRAPSGRAGHGLAYDQSTNSYLLFGDNKQDDTRLYEISYAGESKVVEVSGTRPLPRRLLTLEMIGGKLYCFGGETPLPGSTDVYTYSQNRWSKPLYEGSLSLRAQTGCVLSDKLMIFGGVREKSSLAVVGSSELSVAKKLFFLTVLEIKESSAGSPSASDASQLKFKIVTVGDSGVGKSCLLTRFLSDVYSDFHVSTIGVDYKTVVTMVKGKLVKLLLWDTAGQERFSVVTGNYYRNADGFVIVYDATNRASFEHVDHWMRQIKEHHDCGPNTVTLLLANKNDLVKEVVVSEAEGKAKADSIGALFVPTSAKTSSNVDLAFLTAAQKLVDVRKNIQASSSRPASPGLQLGSRTPARAGGQPNCCA